MSCLRLAYVSFEANTLFLCGFKGKCLGLKKQMDNVFLYVIHLYWDSRTILNGWNRCWDVRRTVESVYGTVGLSILREV